MKNGLNYIYIDQNGAQGMGRRIDVPNQRGLPPVRALIEAFGEHTPSGKLAVIIKDDLMHPLRVDLDEKPPAKELNQFLLWKLKRYLPWPIDQVEMRALPLKEDLAWLTFSLPKPWIAELYESLETRGAQCGYIGGLFATLLENNPLFRAHHTIAFFDDFYTIAHLDKNGDYHNLRSRRLPFDTNDQLDIQTLVQSDLDPLMQGDNQWALFSLAPQLDASLRAIKDALSVQTRYIEVVGQDPLERFQSCLHLKGES